MSSINFDNVYLLLIAVPIILLCIVPFAIAVRKENKNFHNVTSFIIHVLLAIVIAFAAAGTTTVTTVTETDVYVVADMSYSSNIKANDGTIDKYIQNVKSALPNNSRIGVICFGKDAEVLSDLGEPIKKVSKTKVDRSESNISEALEFASTQFINDVVKRIVLITDGKQTDARDKNKLTRTVTMLNERNIKVDAIYLDDNLTEGTPEVQITRVVYSDTVYKGHSETATAQIQSKFTGNVNCTIDLYKNGSPVPVSSTPKTLTYGTTNVTLTLDTTEETVNDYEVRIAIDPKAFYMASDCPENNVFRFVQTVVGSAKILFLGDSTSDLKIFQDAYKLNYGKNVDLRGNVDYFLDPQESKPTSVEDLCKYDEIVICDCDVVSMYGYSANAFVESLKKVVEDLGKSLITIGDLSLKVSDKYTAVDAVELRKAHSALMDLLPVKFGDSSNKKFYAIVLDISASMSQANRITHAVEAIKKLLNMLGENDEFTFFMFYGEIDPGIRTCNATVENKQAVLDELVKFTDPNQLQYSLKQGTRLDAALNIAEERATGVTAGDKQIMVITDGITAYDEDPLVIVDRMRQKGIMTSVIDAGREGFQDPEMVEEGSTLLQEMARIGSGTNKKPEGNAYNISTNAALNFAFAELEASEQKLIIDDYSWITSYIDEVNNGVVYDRTVNKYAFVSGFMNSSENGDVKTPLKVNYKLDNGSYSPVPLYAYKTSNGRVATFTSNLSNWVKDGFANPDKGAKGIDNFLRFMANVIETNVPEVKINHPYLIKNTVSGKYVKVDVNPVIIRSSAVVQVSVRLTTPSGIVKEEPMVFENSSYVYEFETNELGSYTVDILYKFGSMVYEGKTNVSVSYLPEYNLFQKFDPGLLHTAITQGQVSHDGTVEIVNDDSEIGYYTIYYTKLLLIVAVSLFVVDIVIRKIKWEDIRSLFKKVNKTGGKK